MQPPGVTTTVQPTRRRKKDKQVAVGDALTEKEQHHAQIRAQRKLDIEGAPAAGNVGPARAKSAGRKTDKLVDLLSIAEQEPNSKGILAPVTYCIACDHRIMYRNPQRVKEHAVTCSVSYLFACFVTC